MLNNLDNRVLEILSAINISSEEYNWSFEKNENLNGLSVKKDKNNIYVSFSEKAFLFRALGLLKENIDSESYEIKETSTFKKNGIMVDCSRNGVLTVETLKKIIRQISLMGLNTLQLYTEDTFEVEGEPYFGYLRGRYTNDELKEIDDYADSFGIEVIPCIQTLGHFGQILKWDGVYSNITDMPGIVLADEDATYVFIEKLIKTCRETFRSKRIHIGMDEAVGMGNGKYQRIHGDVDKIDLFVRHLNKVVSLCEQYDFEPMIWGDMLLRISGLEGYSDCPVELSNVKTINDILPKNIGYVYWDYYSTTKERYGDLLKIHKDIAENVIFAGGAWRWSNFTSRLKHSLDVSRLALQECAEQGLNEVFATMWGDNGNEASAFASWPAVQLYAEFSFNNNVSDDTLAKRFKTCTGGEFSDFCLLELVNTPTGINDVQGNAGKFLLYQDPLLGLFDYYVKDGFSDYYEQLHNRLLECVGRNGDFDYIFENIATLSEVLALKADLGVRLKTAYDNKNTQELKNISCNIIPDLLNRLDLFSKTFKQQWTVENKIFGLEIMDGRFGALNKRIESAKERIDDYLNGKIASISELEQERLPYNNREYANVWTWNRIISTSL